MNCPLKTRKLNKLLSRSLYKENTRENVVLGKNPALMKVLVL